MMKKVHTNHTKNQRTPKTRRMRSYGFTWSNTPFLRSVNVESEMVPAINGLATQLRPIQPTFSQLTVSAPPAASPAPMMAPMIECVVLTGHWSDVATVSQMALARSAHSMASMSEPGVNVSTSTMSFRTASVT